MGRNFSNIILCLFASGVICSFASCSNELDSFEEDWNFANDEEPATFATRSTGGCGGDVDLSDFPDARTIYSAIYDTAEELWWTTAVEAAGGTRKERGFWVYYNVKTKEIFCGPEEQPGEPRSENPDKLDDRQFYHQLPTEIKDSIYVCADYHTHPPLFRSIYRLENAKVGESTGDVNSAATLGIPGFVGDLDHWLEYSRDLKREYFRLSYFGPGKRTKKLGESWKSKE